MPGSFTLPNPTSPNTSDPLTSLPIRSNFQALAQQVNNADGGALQAGTVTESALANQINPRLERSLTGVGVNFVVSGFQLASSTSNLSITLPAGIAYVNSYYVSSTGLTFSVSASQDTYLDMDQNGSFYYTGANSVANNAASAPLVAGRIRLAKIISNGTVIVQVLQGSINTSPIAPNTQNWFGFDSLGNPVFSLTAYSSLIGRSINIASYSTTNNTTAQPVTNMAAPAIITAGMNIEVTVKATVSNNTANTGVTLTIWDGAVATGTLVDSYPVTVVSANSQLLLSGSTELTPAAGLHTYSVGFQVQGSGTASIQSSASQQASINVKRV